jgi:hypothetical protein
MEKVYVILLTLGGLIAVGFAGWLYTKAAEEFGGTKVCIVIGIVAALVYVARPYQEWVPIQEDSHDPHPKIALVHHQFGKSSVQEYVWQAAKRDEKGNVLYDWVKNGQPSHDPEQDIEIRANR